MKNIICLLKHHVVLFFFFVLPVACKKHKNEEKTKTVLLSQILQNGESVYRFFYSPDNKLICYESYGPMFSVNPPLTSTRTTIEYDPTGQVSRLSTYGEPGAVFMRRMVIENTVDGKVKAATLHVIQTISQNFDSFTYEWTYNNQGRVTKHQMKDKNGKLVQYINFSYNPDGSLKQSDRYENEGNELFLVDRRLFSMPSISHPKGLQAIQPLFILNYSIFLDHVFAQFQNDMVQFFTYDQNGSIKGNYQRLYSAREFNADSTLARQTLTTKEIKPAWPDGTTYLQYEYITQ